MVAFGEAQADGGVTVIQLETDPLAPAPTSPAWWDVPVAEVSDDPRVQAARTEYEEARRAQRQHVRPS